MYHIGYDAAASSDASTAYSLELEPTSRNVHLVTSLQQTSPRATNTTNYWSTCLENSCAHQQTKDILATVLRVQDLRDVGVTLHVYGNSVRY